MTATATRLRDLVTEEMELLREIRHDLHAHPELGYEEHRTSEVVQRELGRAGVAFRAGLAGGTGVIGSLAGGAAGGPAIGLRADMDALPIVEQVPDGVARPWCSTIPGRMHACGHDGHTAILIGAARVLARIAREQPLPRPVTFLFQPAEEGGAGGRRMVEEGVLDGRVLGPPVGSIFGLHGWPEYPLGVVGTRSGPLLAASDRFEIAVRGVGGHAAWPHACRDPIVAAGAIVHAVQTIASRNVGPLEAVVVSITMVEAGSGFNIIPERAVIRGTVRTLSAATQQLAIRRLREIATGVATAYGCTADLDYRINYPVTLNDPAMVDRFDRVASETLGTDRLRPVELPVMGGEDFAFYGQKVPACFFVLGLIPPGASTMPALHHPAFDFTDEAMATGVELFAALALRE
ncbi:MAG TPA: amidohydrolase [Phycisphaerales bacterium]|nr:amidohydrolase [Phycisphaerales bacterium]HMP36570.1 amidohydrolase [Phycisphaerales bacterium]